MPDAWHMSTAFFVLFNIFILIEVNVAEKWKKWEFAWAVDEWGLKP
jgi:hypothetical protein